MYIYIHYYLFSGFLLRNGPRPLFYVKSVQAGQIHNDKSAQAGHKQKSPFARETIAPPPHHKEKRRALSSTNFDQSRDDISQRRRRLILTVNLSRSRLVKVGVTAIAIFGCR